MKKISLYISFILLILFCACEQEEWKQSDISLVPVSTISGGISNNISSIDVYSTRNIVIAKNSKDKLSRYDMIYCVDSVSTNNPSAYYMNFVYVLPGAYVNGTDTLNENIEVFIEGTVLDGGNEISVNNYDVIHKIKIGNIESTSYDKDTKYAYSNGGKKYEIDNYTYSISHDALYLDSIVYTDYASDLKLVKQEKYN